MARRTLLPILALAAVLTVIQLAVCAVGRDFYLTQLTMAAYYAVVALGLCLVMGYAGQISLGHGAFFAIGGYTSAVLTTRPLGPLSDSAWGVWLHRAGWLSVRESLYGGELVTVSPWGAFLAAVCLTAAVAVLVGYPSLRLKGHYLAMATLGFGLIVYRIVLGSELTGAADGITSVPPWTLAPGLAIAGRRALRVQNYYAAWTFTLLVLLVLLNLVHSRVGRALRAVHGSESAANAMGVNTAGLKLQAFVLSAMLASAAGCFLTHFNGGIGPSEASAFKSVRYVALVAAGGMANLWGVLGISTVLNFLSLRGSFGTLDHAVFGVILIAIISFAPQGPLAPIARWLRRLLGGRDGSA